MRELLRALGGCLVAVGATVGIVTATMDLQRDPRATMLILALMVPSEGLNAFGMRRVGSPFYVPLLFIFMTVVGVVLALLSPEAR